MKDFFDYINESIDESLQNDESMFFSLIKKFPKSMVFRVGGSVRDELFSKYHLDMKGIKNKDIDYLIINVPMDEIEKFLSEYGKVEKVGASFGVLKFWFKDQSKREDPIDIAIPRIEKEKEGEKGHRATDVISSHEISPEEDLKRRDFTINMIAKDIHGKFLDPFKGKKDIKNKVLRMIKSSDDPEDPYHHFFIDSRRILRGLQFIARFDLTPDKEIKKWFKIKNHELEHISGERKKEELKKLFEKGIKVSNALKLMKDSDIIPFIFNGVKNEEIDISLSNLLDLLSNKDRSLEFSLALLLKNIDSKRFKKVIREGLLFSDIEMKKSVFYHWIFRENPSEKDFRIWMVRERQEGGFPVSLDKTIEILDSIGYDSSFLKNNIIYVYLFFKDFALKGTDLLEMGFKGKEIGEALDKIKNYLVEFPKNNKKDILLKVIKGKL